LDIRLHVPGIEPDQSPDTLALDGEGPFTLAVDLVINAPGGDPQDLGYFLDG
jgi:hypothetical protein